MLFIVFIERHLIICKNIYCKNNNFFINTVYVKSNKNLMKEKQTIGLSSPEFKRVGERALVSSVNLEKNVK